MIADTDLLVVAFLFLGWAVLFAIGASEDARVGLLSAIAGLFLALELYVLTASVILTTIWLLISLFTLFASIRGTSERVRA